MADYETNSLVFPASKEYLGETLSQLRQYVTEVAERAGLEKATMHRLRLAIDEIATNIIVYGYADRGEGEIRVTTSIDDEFVTISLEDTGIPFDPTQREMPDNFDDPLEEREIGGLGIYLAINGVDDFRYERVGECNRNHFTVRR
ncbi:MAG: ATP-binding protein [Chloroflexota bacterium]|mgnify:CR=1 FL=1|nr:MAG: anti-sigma regulatory factor [Chloroflexota bacterium]